MKQAKTAALITAAMSLMLFAACGGSSNNNPVKPPDNPPSVSVPVTPISAYVGVPVTIQVTAKNTDFNVSSSTGLSCSKSGGNVVCTPSAVGTYTVTVTATADPSKSVSATVTVSDITIGITPGAEETEVGVAKTFNVATQNTDFTVSADPPTGSGCVKTNNTTVTCTPTSAGAYTVTATATALASKKASAILTVNNNLDVMISITSDETDAVVGVSKTFNVTTQNTDFIVADPAIGSGCEKTDNTTVTCTPMSAGTYTVTVMATALASKTASAVLNVSNNSVTGINVARAPNKTQYYIRETELDLTGMVVTATYQDGSIRTLNPRAYYVSGFDTSTAGENTVTISYGSSTAALAFTIMNRSLMSINVVSPAKVIYVRDEPLDTTGMVVKARYDKGPDVVLTNTDYVLSGFSSVAAGSRIVTVSYTEKTITKTANFTVTVNDLQYVGIYVTKLPNKTTYYCGEPLDPTGMVVTAIRNDGVTRPVNGYSIKGGDAFSLSGVNTINVSYAGLDASFNVNAGFDVDITLDTYGGRDNGLVGFNMNKAMVSWKARGICSDMATRVGILYTTNPNGTLSINNPDVKIVEEPTTGANLDITSVISNDAGFASGTKIRYQTFVVIGSYQYTEYYSPEHSFVPRNNQITIHNLTWSTQNVIDQSGTMGGVDYITHFQWNRKTAWQYNGSNTGTPGGWNSTADTASTWAEGNLPLAAGWRLPATAEFIYLRDITPGREAGGGSYYSGTCIDKDYSPSHYGCFFGPEAQLAYNDVMTSNPMMANRRLAVLLFGHAGRNGNGTVEQYNGSSLVGYRLSYATSESFNSENCRYLRADKSDTRWYIDTAQKSKASGFSIRPVRDFDPNN